MIELSEHQQMIARTVHDFVEREVIPAATELEHRNEYPHALVETMKQLGLFGLNIPEAYGGNEIEYTTFAVIFEELSRGWMGLAGIIGTHSVLCDVLVRFGTEDQKQRFLPRLAKGEPRGGICLSEPNAGTDLQAITTVARRDGDTYYVTGSKMWVCDRDGGRGFPGGHAHHGRQRVLKGFSCGALLSGCPAARDWRRH